MSFPRYPKYKASELKWVSESPEHWDIMANKAFLVHRKTEVGTTWNEKVLLSLTLGGVISRDIESGKGKFPSDFSSYQDVDENDLIFCLFDMDETPRTVGLAKSFGMITGAYDVFQCRASRANPKFILYFYLYIDAFKGLRPFYTGLRKVVRPPTFLSIKIPIPPIPEQTAIAEFLDRETGKIDGLVAEQRRLMELLKEKRQAVISHAVTKGLNPHAPMKPSGIEWLGDVPTGWVVCAPKRRIKSAAGGTLIKGMCSDEFSEGLFPGFSASGQNVWLEEYAYDCPAIVLSAVGARCGKAFKADGHWGVVANTHCLFPLPNSDRDYLWYLTNQEDWWEKGGSAQPFVKVSETMARPWVFPPLPEQTAIADFLDTELAKFDTLTAEAQRAIDLLQERRTALISAAVTGQIDVRKEAA